MCGHKCVLGTGLLQVKATHVCFSRIWVAIKLSCHFFHSRTVHLDIINVLSPTDAKENYFKRSVKIYIKTAPTYFGVIIIIMF
jgi:hypothetical protein